MKVYVLLESTRNSEYEYCGVFATEEQAQKRLEEIQKDVARELNLYIQEEEIGE